MNTSYKTCLIVVAHPDDEVLGCGGLISKYASHVDFHILFLAEGSSCRFADPLSKDVQDAIKKRTTSAVHALTELGVKSWEFVDFPCGRLDQIPLIEINKIVEKAIAKFKPDVLITHSDSDANQDHVKVCKSCVIASRPYQSCIKLFLACEIPSSTEWGFLQSFHPSFCVELSAEDVNQKYFALSRYETEVKPYPFPRSFNGIEALAKFRGMQFGFNYGEAYRVIRCVMS